MERCCTRLHALLNATSPSTANNFSHYNFWYRLGAAKNILKESFDAASSKNIISLVVPDNQAATKPFFNSSSLPTIFKQFSSPRQLIKLYHLQQSLQNVQIIFCGESGVGKTSIIERIVHDQFDRGYDLTIGTYLYFLQKIKNCMPTKLIILK